MMDRGTMRRYVSGLKATKGFTHEFSIDGMVKIIGVKNMRRDNPIWMTPVKSLEMLETMLKTRPIEIPKVRIGMTDGKKAMSATGLNLPTVRISKSIAIMICTTKL